MSFKKRRTESPSSQLLLFCQQCTAAKASRSIFWGTRFFLSCCGGASSLWSGLVSSFQTFKMTNCQQDTHDQVKLPWKRGRGQRWARRTPSTMVRHCVQVLGIWVLSSQTHRCVNYPFIQMKLRPAVGFFLKLQHKGQLLFVYLAGVESFVNSQESVPLSFTGKPPNC